jgi:magnesium-transporting ATPase (P-type)
LEGAPVHCSNEVVTTKYTWWNFLPKNLFEQFYGKLANVFFLFVIFMETQPSVSISGGKAVTLMPLSFVMLISMIKDAFEDCKRRKSDKEANGLYAEIYNTEKREFEKDKEWKDIKVGDFIKIDKQHY